MFKEGRSINVEGERVWEGKDNMGFKENVED